MCSPNSVLRHFARRRIFDKVCVCSAVPLPLRKLLYIHCFNISLGFPSYLSVLYKALVTVMRLKKRKLLVNKDEELRLKTCLAFVSD